MAYVSKITLPSGDTYNLRDNEASHQELIISSNGNTATIDNNVSGATLTSLVVPITPMQYGSGTPSSSNIRYISGWTGVDAYVSATTTPSDGTKYETTWQSSIGTVYGGQFEMVSGTLTVTHGYIESYNGETLPGEWISDRDAYVVNTNPSTGAEVVYALASPVSYTVFPTNIALLNGTNYISAQLLAQGLPISQYEKGSIGPGGVNSDYRANARARTKEITVAPFDFYVAVHNPSSAYNFGLDVPYYQSDGTSSESTSWVYAGNSVKITQGTLYRIFIRDANNDTSTSSQELSVLISAVWVYKDVEISCGLLTQTGWIYEQAIESTLVKAALAALPIYDGTVI